MNIVNIKIGDIKPYKNNPRKPRRLGNQNAVDAVANSIKAFGFKVPVIVDRNNEIVAGHTRMLAAKKLGIKEIPCIIADDLTEEQIKAFRLADNKTHELAEWDFDLLADEIAELTRFDFTEFGFEDTETQLPNFDPVSEGEQPRLDKKSPITCPRCGTEFIPK